MTETECVKQLFNYGLHFARSGGHRMAGWEKMRRTTAQIALALVSMSMTAGADVDFTPRHGFVELEGFRTPIVKFTASQNPVSWTPPSKWRISGSAKALTAVPEDSPMASAAFRCVTLREELPATEGSQAVFIKTAQASLPPLAEAPEVLGSTVDPLQINGLHTCAVTIRYLLNQQRFITTIVFVPKGREQFRLEFTARERDFKPLHESFLESLYTIQGL